MKPFVLAAFLLLSACGFEPLYAMRQDEPSAHNPYAVRVASIPERYGIDLRRKLIDSIGPEPEKPAYTLKVSLSSAVTSEQAVGQDDISTRRTLALTATYTLIDAKGAIMTAGQRTARSGYNVLGSPYASDAGADDTITRMVDSLSRDVATMVQAYFKQKRNGQEEALASPPPSRE